MQCKHIGALLALMQIRLKCANRIKSRRTLKSKLDRAK